MIEFAATSPLTIALFVIILSFVAAILGEKLKVSYTTVLIIMGFTVSLLGISGELGNIPADRTVILGLLVPPLIFEAAMRTRYATFRTVRKTVLALAIFGVVVSALASGAILNVGLGLPLAAALTFGVIVSPTDPVSVVNALKTIRAPERLTTILETEAYFNDATAVMLYPVALSLSFSPLHEIGVFAYTLGGGVVVGLLVSGIAELLYRLVTEPLAETTFTIVVMFGSYLFAESLGVSGLVAVAIAGLYMGNRTMRIAMSEQTRQTMTTFWEIVTFVATSFAFLLLSLQADFRLMVTFSPFIIGACVAMFLSRAISVYPIVSLTSLLGEKIPSSWTKVLAMAGMRGAVSVALALSLPASSLKEEIVTMTFGVALVSLVVQGEFLRLYLKRTGLS
jgi:CPA1 family monovalent cation:H+ antiporter